MTLLLISSVPERDESYESDPNSDITDPGEIESHAGIQNFKVIQNLKVI